MFTFFSLVCPLFLLLLWRKAEQWDLANPLQTCGFQVERRNNDLYLLFTTENHTKLFALTKVSDNANQSVESVMDSSRYFVTQVQSNGRSAYIGFGFRDRDVALDLISNLQQFQRSIQREQQSKNMKVTEIPKLAEGETIHISFGKNSSGNGSNSTEKKTKSTPKSATGSSGSGPMLLKKPPKVETTPSGTLNMSEPENLHLSMGNINLQEDHKSIASSASDCAHATDNVNNDPNDDDDDDDEWDDFQQA